MSIISRVKFLAIILPIFMLILGFLALSFHFVLKGKHEDEIHKVIEADGGAVLDIEKVNGDSSPFEKLSGANRYYKVVFKQEGKRKTAWYRGSVIVNNIHKTPKDGYPEKWLFNDQEKD
ncbi:hypothetical protein [Pontibacillus sp. HMF3514]|uniref:hypothetical protein n=1 Tax=Pontibacillus sp. HMF3514 TaxID=2692425 RepID=UPI00131FEEF4|nr:hypothetical protein [Pontibacillus sp. HMF3514]QHE53677.1 hypothetical protein GS400_17370 [Pontibacillus sp. HMF3514]